MSNSNRGENSPEARNRRSAEEAAAQEAMARLDSFEPALFGVFSFMEETFGLDWFDTEAEVHAFHPAGSSQPVALATVTIIGGMQVETKGKFPWSKPTQTPVKWLHLTMRFPEDEVTLCGNVEQNSYNGRPLPELSRELLERLARKVAADLNVPVCFWTSDQASCRDDKVLCLRIGGRTVYPQ